MEYLDPYKRRKFLTLHEAVSLACGCDPADNWVPNDYGGTYRLLEEAVMIDLVRIRDMVNTSFDDITFNFEPLTFLDEDIPEEKCKELGIFFGANETRRTAFTRRHSAISINAGDASIKTSELLRWFEANNFTPRFFFPGSLPEQPEDKPQHRYRTRLMNIMDRTIARYYGDNFDIDDKNSYPLQAIVVEWLQAEFSLSRKQAEAIELIIAPRNNNNPKAN